MCVPTPLTDKKKGCLGSRRGDGASRLAQFFDPPHRLMRKHDPVPTCRCKCRGMKGMHENAGWAERTERGRRRRTHCDAGPPPCGQSASGWDGAIVRPTCSVEPRSLFEEAPRHPRMARLLGRRPSSVNLSENMLLSQQASAPAHCLLPDRLRCVSLSANAILPIQRIGHRECHPPLPTAGRSYTHSLSMGREARFPSGDIPPKVRNTGSAFSPPAQRAARGRGIFFPSAPSAKLALGFPCVYISTICGLVGSSRSEAGETDALREHGGFEAGWCSRVKALGAPGRIGSGVIFTPGIYFGTYLPGAEARSLGAPR
ncbi:hypothetical protein B0H14DRAFT_2582157 [Mycena olivaceomarginata]|nr:hypothetical protein B0H14DRAFT_2582157 [Mycena olivaceomarginata]